MLLWVPVAPSISWVAHSRWLSSCSLNDFLVFLPLNPVWTQQGFWRFSQIGLNACNPGLVTSSLGVKGLYQRISLQEGWCPGHLFWGRVCVRVHFFSFFLKNLDGTLIQGGELEGALKKIMVGKELRPSTLPETAQAPLWNITVHPSKLWGENEMSLAQCPMLSVGFKMVFVWSFYRNL